MQSCAYFLYESLLRQFPFSPSDATERAYFDQLNAAESRVQQLPNEYWHTIFDLINSMDVVDHAKACHAFSLGLGLGLSLAQEINFLQSLQ